MFLQHRRNVRCRPAGSLRSSCLLRQLARGFKSVLGRDGRAKNPWIFLQNYKDARFKPVTFSHYDDGIPRIQYPALALRSALRHTISGDIYPPQNKPTTLTQGEHLRSLDKVKYQLKQIYPADLAMSLSTILAQYLQHVHQPQARDTNDHDGLKDEAILHIFSERALALLSRKRNSVGDVMAWAWILSSLTPYQAALRYREFAKERNRGPIPHFVLFTLIHRRDIDAISFRVFLKASLDLVDVLCKAIRPVSTTRATPLPDDRHRLEERVIDDTLCRLLSLARLVSPSSIPAIAEAFTRSFANLAPTFQLDQLGIAKASKLTHLYNKYIHLVTRTCNIDPYHSSRHQKQAVFHILRHMGHFKPPLPVNRQSYRSLVRVLLASPLTEAEITWDNFKAASWPPWKKDRLGIDEGMTEGSKSKAAMVIELMHSMGYSSAEWDHAALVASGWDTDGTPTIQKRTKLPALWHSGHSSRSDGPTVWAMRIRATRTISEAWACYLSMEQQGIPLTDLIVHELLDKLIAHETLQRLEETSRQPGFAKQIIPMIAGGKGVKAEPTSSRDAVHLSRDVPTVFNFLQDVYFPSGGLLAASTLTSLLKATVSLQQGLVYIKHSMLDEAQIFSLLAPLDETEPLRRQTLLSIDPAVFAAFIRFLCRRTFSGEVDKQKSKLSALNFTFPILFPYGVNPDTDTRLSLGHAASLMELYNSRNASAWIAIFKAVALGSRPVRKFPTLGLPRGVERVFSWEETLRVLSWMQAGSVALPTVCIQLLCNAYFSLMRDCHFFPRAVEDAVSYINEIEDASNEQARPKLTNTNASDMIDHGHEVLKTFIGQLMPISGDRHKRYLAGSADEDTLLPTTHALHAMVRAFGRARDRQTVVAVLRILHRQADELKVEVERKGGSPEYLRRAVVASRVYLEYDVTGSKKDSKLMERPSKWCTDPLVWEARRLVEESKEMAPWPSMEEVRSYVEEQMRQTSIYTY